MAEKFYNIGKIVNTQGLKGEVRIISSTDFPQERYQKGSKLSLIFNGERIEMTVKSHRRQKNFDIVSFVEYPSINDVERFKGIELQVSEEQQGQLAANEFYFHEIVGLPVYTVDDEYLGDVKEILGYAANDVWVIKQKRGKDILIPYIEQVVKKVDIENKRIEIELMEGLIDDED